MINRVEILAAGWGRHLETFLHGNGKLRKIDIPANFAVIHHQQYGIILYDTGYSPRFFEATRNWPERLLRYLTPVVRLTSAAEQLAERGLVPSHLILGHLHPDHIAGLKDFPQVRFHAPATQKPLFEMGRWASLRHLILRDYWPPDFGERIRWVEPVESSSAFGPTFPILEGLTGVPLPGHARGQMGLMLQCEGHKLFLIADAAFTSQALRENLLPNWLLRGVADNWEEARDTFDKLRDFQREHPQWLLIPSHCPEMVGRTFPPHG